MKSGSDSTDERRRFVKSITVSEGGVAAAGLCPRDERSPSEDERRPVSWISELHERTILTPPDALPAALMALVGHRHPTAGISWALRSCNGECLWRLGAEGPFEASCRIDLWGFRHELGIGAAVVPAWLQWLPQLWQQSHWTALELDRRRRALPDLPVGSVLRIICKTPSHGTIHASPMMC